MKNYLRSISIVSLYFVSCFCSVFAQVDFPRNEAGQVEYSEVVSVDSVSADVLYGLCKKWFAKYYVSSQNVIQSDSKNNVVGKAVMNLKYVFGSMSTDIYFNYVVDISIKEGKYKYVIGDFSPVGAGSLDNLIENAKSSKNKNSKKANEYVLEQIKTNVASIISSLKASMKAKDDW